MANAIGNRTHLSNLVSKKILKCVWFKYVCSFSAYLFETIGSIIVVYVKVKVSIHKTRELTKSNLAGVFDDALRQIPILTSVNLFNSAKKSRTL